MVQIYFVVIVVELFWWIVVEVKYLFARKHDVAWPMVCCVSSSNQLYHKPITPQCHLINGTFVCVDDGPLMMYMVPTISWQWNSRTFPGLFQDISEFSRTLTDLMIDKKVNTQHKTIYETGQHIAKPGNYYLKPNKYNHSLINVAYQIWSMTMIKSQLIQRSVICNNSMG